MSTENKIIKIDIEKNVPKTFKYEKYKDDGVMKFLVLEDNQIVDLSNYVAKTFFSFSKNDFFSVQCNIIENVVEIPLSETFLNKKGLVAFEIVFTGKKQRVTTFKMYLKI